VPDVPGDDTPDTWTPAFPGQRPPFTASNEAALRHGARTERRVAPLAAEIERALLADPDMPAHLHRPEFKAAVSAWARAEAVVQCIWNALAEQDFTEAMADITKGAETEETVQKGTISRRSVQKRTVSSLEQLRRYEAHAATLRSRLGLDPVGAAKLAKDLSQSRFYQAASPLDRALGQLEEERRRAITGDVSD
jgi:hypothetical protein